MKDTAYSSFTRVYIFGGYIYYVDNLRIRKYAEIEPSAAFGAEEYGLTYTVTTISVEHVIIEHSAMQNVYVLDENDEIIKQYTNLSNITDGEIATRLDFRNDTGKTVKKVIIESVSGVINTIIL